MNRIIKFRVWDKKRKHLSVEFNSYYGISSNRNGEWMVGWEGDGRESGNMKKIDGVNLILMQFTGLTDKKGKEIYEGDIVSDDGFTAPVELDIKDGLTWGSFTDVQNGEVIGNIYENPELLTNKS